MVILIMGVTGSGKSTIGAKLAADLGWSFIDADNYHSPASIQKMSSGVPLTDKDRRPWLEKLRALISERHAGGESTVLACSALKNSYRSILATDGDLRVVFLEAEPELIESRLAKRKDHFMAPQLIQSQFRTLEEPESAVTVPASWAADRLVAAIRSELGI